MLIAPGQRNESNGRAAGRVRNSAIPNGVPKTSWERIGLLRWFSVILLFMGVWCGCSQRTSVQQRQESEAAWRRVRASVRYQLATQQYAGGLTSEAIDTVEEAIALDPDAVDYYVLLARACQEHGQLSRARRTIEMATRVAPMSAEVAYTYGTIEERCQQSERALVHFERAGELDPTQVEFLIARAECLVTLERAEEGYELVAERIHDFDRDGTLETLLGRIGLLLGRDEEAAASFRIALDIIGDDDPLSEQYGLLLHRLGRHAEAIAVLKPLVDSQGGSAGGAIVRTLANSYLQTGDASKAEQVVQAHLKSHPDDAQAWLLLAKSAILTGELPTARRCADRVADLAPDHPQTHLIRGYVSSRENRLHDARRSYELALQLNPTDVLVHCLLGDVFHRLQETSRARSHYSRALQIDADCRWARRALNELDASDLLDQESGQQFSRLDP